MVLTRSPLELLVMLAARLAGEQQPAGGHALLLATALRTHVGVLALLQPLHEALVVEHVLLVAGELDHFWKTILLGH